MSIVIAASIGLAAAGVVAVAGHRARALSGSGAAAAVVVGTAIFGLGGWRWASVMIGFFVLSSLLSRAGRRRKRPAEGFVEKGSRRDAVQVLANGGIGALVAVIHGFDPSVALLFPAFLGSMAAATADTWSTEIGSLSSKPPRSILSWKHVPTGSSGGVTVLGLVGALAGATIIGLIGGVANLSAVALVVAGVIAGFTGSLFDSVLGATVQRVNRCPQCMTLTERAVHDCGTPTVVARGWRFIDNDMVNAMTTLYGAFCGALLYLAVK